MCLAIPGQIVEIVDDQREIAKVEFSGVRRNVSITLVRQDGADIGKWVLVHVGFALRVLDENEARETLRFLESIGEEYRKELEQLDGEIVESDSGSAAKRYENPNRQLAVE